MADIISLVAALCFIVLVAAVVLVVYLRLTERRVWEHEDEFCDCTHDFYDHFHLSDRYDYSPCAKQMCSCQMYRPTKETS